jgi:hypothetical protein
MMVAQRQRHGRVRHPHSGRNVINGDAFLVQWKSSNSLWTYLQARGACAGSCPGLPQAPTRRPY